MGLFNKIFGGSSNRSKQNKEDALRSALEKQIKQDGIPLAAKQIATLINEKINSRDLAKQFVLEELDAARQGGIEDATNFAKESGFSPSEYIGAMQKTQLTCNERELEYIQMLMRSFTYSLSDKILMCRLNIAIVDEVMDNWYLGKYDTLTSDKNEKIYSSDIDKKRDEYDEILNTLPILQSLINDEELMEALSMALDGESAPVNMVDRINEFLKIIYRLSELTGADPGELLDNDGQIITEHLDNLKSHINADDFEEFEAQNQDDDSNLVDKENLDTLADEQFLEFLNSGKLPNDVIKAAEQGDVIEQYNIGIMYETGLGVAQDYCEAIKWFKKAAEQGYAEAQNKLGVMYSFGHGIARNDSEALKWSKKAAEKGVALAQYNVGVAYAEGRGIDKDDTQAENWYRKAAEQGLAPAQCNLGIMLYHGTQGVAQNYSEALKWFRKAAEQVDSGAQQNIGVMYAHGQGVAQNHSDAVKWFKKAAQQGDAEGQRFLGIMYATGSGVVQDDNEAIKWLRKAAEQGNARAQQNLAVMYSKQKR